MTTYTAHCKFCGKKYELKSNWVPGEVLVLIINIKHFFHTLRHHYKECNFKRDKKILFRILIDVFKGIGIISWLILIKIIKTIFTQFIYCQIYYIKIEEVY